MTGLDLAEDRLLEVACLVTDAELTVLDQAIGDGDHGANMKRGFEAVLGNEDRKSVV